MKPRNLLFSLFLFYTVTTAQTTIQPGTTLSAANPGQKWSSPNNIFYLEFSQVGVSSSYTLNINYNGGIPIWTAGNATTTVDSKGSFQFLSSGSLRLINGSDAVVWDSNTARLGVTTASLDDFGNLVLKNGTSTVWSSFDIPTDTIVPNQTLSAKQVLRSGSYSFTFLSTGNLTLRWNDTIEYWNKGLNSSVDANLTSPTLGLQPTGILTIFDVAFTSGSYIVAYTNDYAEGSSRLRFLRLEKNGNLRLYSSDISTGNTTIVWSALADQCEIFYYCGNMGICSYNESSSTPNCGCPSENFEPVDVNDSRQGCKRKVEIESCAGTATMLVLDNAKFLTYQPETLSQVYSSGISACRMMCLSQSSCIASTSLSDGTGMCYLKNSAFISGYQNPALPSTSFVKVCGPTQPNPPPGVQIAGKSKSSRLPVWVVLVVVLITLLGLIAVEGGLWWWCCRNSPKFGSLSAQYALLEYASETNRKKFSDWAYEEFEKSNVSAILDQRLTDQDVDMQQVRRAVQVSFWCIQDQPSQRPTMGKVVQMLEGIFEIENPPAPKAITEGSIHGTSIMSSNLSALSTFAPSAPYSLIFLIKPDSRSFTITFWEKYREGIFISAAFRPKLKPVIIHTICYNTEELEGGKHL
ncbi:G-TYPE LECTIN S-RECEPTOR SERINE/THREONINE-PROTEIN KINASE [Salix koriyanagi]|uniref:non-specific serine/threonine protein kinase n=1 Tax=Salix koriyanagi TaxID=2511006 RepID=A0A9Q1A8A3_9ROSI|nr:G-TYPE LECTIN S-RECEPTOR SERINE/THREONINE-PROTEIN KINASE [Salix koriyanagi]